MPTASRSARSRGLTAALAGLGALAAVYLAQLPSPLRLDTDSAAYLQIASSIADGHGSNPRAVPSFPLGYPVLVAALDRAGLGTPWALVALNLAFLALGLAALAVVLRRGLGLGDTATTVVCALTLLSASVAKNTMLPLSEIAFFGVVAASLAALTLAAARVHRGLLVAGILLAVVACVVRTAGIGLVPAVVLAFPNRRSRVIAACATVAGGALAVAAMPRYVDELRRGWDGGLLASAWQELHDLLVMLGAAFANVPQSKLHEVEPLLVVVGLAALPLVAWGLYARRRALGPVDGWIVGGLGVLYVWPSDAARFMLPIFPFLLGYGALLVRRRAAAGIAYAVAFAALGVVALTLSTRITYAGRSFPERYAGGVLAPTYRVAWGWERPGDRERAVGYVLSMVRRYDPSPP